MAACGPAPSVGVVPVLFEVGFAMALIGYLVGLMLMAFVPAGGLRKMGSSMVHDSLQAVFVMAIAGTPAAVFKFLAQIGLGDMNGPFTALFNWLGINCAAGKLVLTPAPGLMQNVFAGILFIVTQLFWLVLLQFGITTAARLVSQFLGFAVGVGTLVNVAAALAAGVIGLWVSYQYIGYWPIFSLAPQAVFNIIAVYYLSQFVVTFFPVILAFGGMLFALPIGRIGKRWGAAVIALGLVMFLGLPLMPVFVGTFGSPQSAMQAVGIATKSSPEVSSILSRTKQPDAFFSVRTLGPQYTDSFMLQIEGFTIWTDSSGYAAYPLPTGTHSITGVTYLGVPVTFSSTPKAFDVDEGSSEPGIATPPLKTATVTVTVDVYAFVLRKVQFDVTQPLNPPVAVTAPFFLDLNPSYLKGATAPYVPSAPTLDAVNITLCPTAKQVSGQIFVPTPTEGKTAGTDVSATWETLPVSLTPTATRGDLKPTVGASGRSDGVEFAFSIKTIPSISSGTPACKELSLQANNIVQFNYNYAQNDVDPTGYKPPTLTTNQQIALQSSLDQITYTYMVIIFLPIAYLLILASIAAGMANLIVRRWS